MQRREIGRTGIQVAPLAFGGNVFGWTADEPTSFALLDAFVDAGFNLIDTADVYSRWVEGHSGGESETILGKWLKRSGKRDRVVLATKVGMDMGNGETGLSAAYIQRAVDRSLKRLGVDCIDLYQAHKDDESTPLEETLGAFAKLIQAGKVRAIGASNYSAERLSEALRISKQNGLPRYECLQPLYNLSDRAVFEDALEGVCREAAIGVIPYYSLAAGFLSGKYRSEADLEGRARSRTVKAYLNDRGYRILKALDEAAKQTGRTQAQVAIAWLLAKPAVTAPIASATSVEQLKDLLVATEIRLSAETMRSLDEASR
jgi:aryl-alcohol dehydrogenase-like predicted oxidoreductase